MKDKINGQPCPCGKSSDAFTQFLDEEGDITGGKCHSGKCDGKFWTGKDLEEAEYKGVKVKPRSEKKVSTEDLPQWEFKKYRGISEEVCKMFDISVSTKAVGFGHYNTSGERVGLKAKLLHRTGKKVIQSKGNMSLETLALFGENLFKPGGKYVSVYEGEEDAASGFEMHNKVGAHVSVTHGSQSAAAQCKNRYEYLNSFDTVHICFDNDEEGRKAAKQVAALFPGKAKIVKLSHFKDANEYLKNNKRKEFVSEWWNAQEVKMAGISGSKEEWLSSAKVKPVPGTSLVWDGLNKVTRGVRPGEIWTFGGGTKIGKSELLKRLTYGLVTQHDAKVGMIMLEENEHRTKQCLIGQHLRNRYYIEGNQWPTEQELDDAAELFGGKVYIDTDRSSQFESVKAKIEYMVRGLGCKYIMLDHLTAIAEGKSKDVNSILHEAFEVLNHMVTKENFSIFAISHLNQALNKNHEEGARVTLRDFYGSGAIKQRSNFVFGFEGDLQGNVIPHNKRVLRCLADRNAGDGGGKTVHLEYNTGEGVLDEVEFDDGKTELDEALLSDPPFDVDEELFEEEKEDAD